MGISQFLPSIFVQIRDVRPLYLNRRTTPISRTIIFASTLNELATTNPLTINNTGNAVPTVEVEGINLRGLVDTTLELNVGNFSVNVANACGGDSLSNDSSVGITGSSLGLNTVEELYYCLETVGTGIAVDTYNTDGVEAWTVRIV